MYNRGYILAGHERLPVQLGCISSPTVLQLTVVKGRTGGAVGLYIRRLKGCGLPAVHHIWRRRSEGK